MNRWRIAIIVTALVSLTILLVATWFGWEPWSLFRSLRQEWQPEPAFFRRLSQPDQTYTFLSALSVFVTLYLSGILILFLIPARVRHMEQTLAGSGKRLLRLAALGLLAGLLVGVVGLSSAMTITTFPLTFVLLSLLFLSSYVGYIALAYALGHGLFLNAGWGSLSPVYSLFIGLLVLFAFGQIPLLGDFIKIACLALGIGVVISTRFGSGETWNLAPLMEDASLEP